MKASLTVEGLSSVFRDLNLSIKVSAEWCTCSVKAPNSPIPRAQRCWATQLRLSWSFPRASYPSLQVTNTRVRRIDLSTKKCVYFVNQEFWTKNLMPYLGLRVEFMLSMWPMNIWDEIVTPKCDSRPWYYTIVNQTQNSPLSHTLSGGHTGFP